MGGGGLLRLPREFSALSEDDGARTPVLGTPVHAFYSHMWKFQTQVARGQVTRSRQVTSTHKKFAFFVIAAPTNRSPWSFHWLIWVTVSVKCRYIAKFDIADLRPKVRSILQPLHYKSMGEDLKAPLLDENYKKYSNIRLQLDLTPWIGKLRTVTPPHAFEIISDHERSPASFRQLLLKQARAVKTP